MTTNRIEAATPYDIDIATLSAKIAGGEGNGQDRYWLTMRRAQKDAYLAALQAKDAQKQALVAALESLLGAHFTGGYCPWCGRLAELGHLSSCPKLQAQAALAAAEEEA